MKNLGTVFGLLVVLLALGAGPAGAQGTVQRPFLGHPAPDFTLPDAGGHSFSFASLTGKPVTMFFFCSCDKCHKVARAWEGILSNTAMKPDGETVVVFSGNAAEAKTFSDEVGFRPGDVTMLCDEDLKVTEKYRSEPCPSVFTVATNGGVSFDSKQAFGDDESSPSVLLPAAMSSLSKQAAPSVVAPLQTGSGEGKGPKLTPLDFGGVKEEVPGTANANVVAPYARHVAYTVKFKNSTDRVMHISEARASCGCTKLDLMMNGKKEKHPEVKPGQTLEVVLHFQMGLHDTIQAWLYDDSLFDAVGMVLLDLKLKK